MVRRTRRRFLADAGVAALYWLLPSRAAAAATGWPYRASHGPFRCASEMPLRTMDAMFADLSDLERELGRTLATPPANQTIDVLLFADESSHRQYLTTAFPRVPYRRALYVQRSGRGAVYAYFHRELSIDLRHECTHALLHCNLPMVPLWLDEGLAEYFEVPKTHRAFGHPHLARLRWDLRLGMVRPLETLEKHHELSEMGSTQYRFAWAWVHFMLHGPQVAHQQLVEYLADIRRGNPPGMLSERLHRALGDPTLRMKEHFRNWHA
jgi:hypothetical protein